jgi:patatin-like phospholipase/acyl hydrolase
MSYKILSLDGGGSWALVQARVLLDIYGDIRGHELLRQFDMAIGNSGGSLVLACLCTDMKITEIIGVFKNQDEREQVFSELTFWDRIHDLPAFIKSLGPKYSMQRKLEGLRKILAAKDHMFNEKSIQKPIIDTPLNELPAIIKKESLQLLIVGFDYFHERVSFFRSNPKSETDKFSAGKFYQVTLAHAIHSSSNAPISYFDAPAQINVSLLNGNDSRTAWYWDGAVSGFNNPVLAGLIEAITNNYKSPQEYSILSLGTGTGSQAIITDYEYSSNPDIKAIYDKNKDNKDFAITNTSSGFLQDIKKMSESILDDPPDSSTFIAYSILDPSLSNKANLIRINPCTRAVLNNATGLYDAPEVYRNMQDGVQTFKDLMNLGMDAVKDKEVNLIDEMCNKFIVNDSSPCLDNQLIRGDAGTGVYLGQPNYREAKAKWMSCK